MTQNIKSFWVSLYQISQRILFTNNEISYMITICCKLILQTCMWMVLFGINSMLAIERNHGNPFYYLLNCRLSFQYTKHIALKIRPKIEGKVVNNFLPYVLSATWESSPSKYYIAFSREVARDVRHKFLINKCYTSFLSISEMIQDYVVQPYYNKGAIFYAKTSVFLMWL